MITFEKKKQNLRIHLTLILQLSFNFVKLLIFLILRHETLLGFLNNFFAKIFTNKIPKGKFRFYR